MSVRGFLVSCVMSLYLSQREKTGGSNIRLYLALAFPLSCVSSYCSASRGWFGPLSVLGCSSAVSVYAWRKLGCLNICHPCVSQNEKGGFHTCLYLPSLSQLSFSVYLLQNEGRVFAYVRTRFSPSQLSCLPTFRKVRKGWF